MAYQIPKVMKVQPTGYKEHLMKPVSKKSLDGIKRISYARMIEV